LDLKTVKKTIIYGEYEAVEAKARFAYIAKKYMAHVDTFYYSVQTRGNWNEDASAAVMFGELWTLREIADDRNEPVVLSESEDFLSELSVNPFAGFINYRLNIGKKDCFDIFLAERVMDGKMPGI
jgi:hypothetical protein